VQIKPVHIDNLNQTGYSGISCVRTLGAAGTPLLGESITYHSEESGCILYPNPNDGSEFTLYNKTMEGRVVMRVLDAQGREIDRLEFEANKSTGLLMRFSKPLCSGLYQLECVQGNRHELIRMSVGR
jgi:hypothetical protein